MGRTLLFGANGQVGREIISDFSARNLELIALGRNDCDLLKAGEAADAIAAHNPRSIINAAAYTAVDRAEEEPEIAARLNAEAVEEIALAANNIGADFIHISTDYVFDGSTDEALSEDAPVNPLNTYGATKLDGEQRALAAFENAVILRTSWVYSEHGGNFVKTMLRLGSERNHLSIVADQIGGPTSATSIAQAARSVLAQIRQGGRASGLFHFQGAPAVSWAQFAEAIFAAARLDVTVDAIETSKYPTPAVRPLRTVLDCTRIKQRFGISQPDWRDDLARTVTALQSAADAKKE